MMRMACHTEAANLKIHPNREDSQWISVRKSRVIAGTLFMAIVDCDEIRE
jgi:hypothetical protein